MHMLYECYTGALSWISDFNEFVPENFIILHHFFAMLSLND